LYCAPQEDLSIAKANSGAAGQLQHTVQEQAAAISSLQVRCSSNWQPSHYGLLTAGQLLCAHHARPQILQALKTNACPPRH
jgi:hypothetical protein